MHKDLATLARFCGEFDYERGLLLIYGLTPDVAVGRFERALAGRRRPCSFELWVHPLVGAPAERLV